jgi:hypothetical protein
VAGHVVAHLDCPGFWQLLTAHRVRLMAAAVDPADSRGVPAAIPVALVQPNLAKWLWLLIFADGSVLRRLEPVGDERTPKAAT